MTIPTPDSKMGNDDTVARKDTYYKGLAHSVRDRLMQRWIEGQRAYYNQKAKRIYYLSMEFLPGRFLMNYITNMQINELCEQALNDLPFSLEDLEEEFRTEAGRVQQDFAPEDIEVREILIRPRKTDIMVGDLVLVWTPWRMTRDGLAEPLFELQG